MVEENRGALDEGTWQIVNAFFHPERKAYDGSDAAHDAVVAFAGLFSDAIGITGESLSGAVAAPNFYSGRPAWLVWSADENEDKKNYWRAQIMVTSGIGFEERVIVTVTDSQGENIKAATLILLNSTLVVSNGSAEYSLVEFQRNLANTNVALVYPDGRRVPGGLNLGDVFV